MLRDGTQSRPYLSTHSTFLPLTQCNGLWTGWITADFDQIFSSQPLTSSRQMGSTAFTLNSNALLPACESLAKGKMGAFHWILSDAQEQICLSAAAQPQWESSQTPIALSKVLIHDHTDTHALFIAFTYVIDREGKEGIFWGFFLSLNPNLLKTHRIEKED